MSVMNNVAVGLGEVLTQVQKLYLAAQDTVRELENVMKELEELSGRKHTETAQEDTSIVPEELLKEETPPQEKEKEAPPDEAPPAPGRTVTLEEVRKVMSAKCRAGYRAEVKALLRQHGLEALSQAKDPELLAVLMDEAEQI